MNSTVDFIGSVICSDLKGPMNPCDRQENRYIVDFIDHRTKTKEFATHKSKHYMPFFMQKFKCRIHVLRTDGEGEYHALYLFCYETGIARQVSEPLN